MSKIALLTQDTIDKIAAGEVVERPCSVVKELVENAIDAKATAITIEIKEGGISFIRISDNGCGIDKSEVPLAFLRHSTSKIKSVEDLLSVSSLGFRGEALSSIAAVAQVELITKTYGDLTGTRYVIEGSKEIVCEEIGAPEGTTFLVKNLFFNTPVRRKFLKSAQTEGNYIADLMERMALSHPDISFKFINNGQTKLHTSGNGNKKDLIYHVYGRDITSSLLPIEQENELFKVSGFIGKPNVSRGNRNYENYYINGRYIKSALLAKAIEEAYKGFMMQHQYPFCVLYFEIKSELIDVNVHPTKMELRFTQNETIYKLLYEIIRNALTHKEFIPQVPVTEEKKEPPKRPVVNSAPEPFEVRRLNEERRLNDIRKAVSTDSPYERKYPDRVRETNSFGTANQIFSKLSKTSTVSSIKTKTAPATIIVEPTKQKEKVVQEAVTVQKEVVMPKAEVIQEEIVLPKETLPQENMVYEQQQLDTGFLSADAKKHHKIIGQLFDTYWLVEFEEKLFIIDQHAAHEKVLYEQTIGKLKEQNFVSQAISPPIILTLSNEEAATLTKYEKELAHFGYEIEPFGGKEYAITAIPADFSEVDMKAMFLDMLEDFATINGENTPMLILEKIASMSCKAAVKGHNRLSFAEAEHLIDTLLTLENPYQCPHGRPTIIAMTKYEIEKKFKRIV